MSKSIYRLSDIAVRAASAGATLNDGGGLLYRATAKAAGRWVFKFTSGDPDYLARQVAKGSALRQREMGWGLSRLHRSQWRAKRLTMLGDRWREGLDPIEEARRSAEAAEAQAELSAKMKAADAMTFGRYADEVFLPTKLPGFSNPAHIQQWRATFSTHAAALRSKPLSAITREDVLTVLLPIWADKSVTASRSRERIERLFAHAIQNGQFHRDNPATWRQFDATLPSPRKLTRGHHPAVPHDRISTFVAVLRAKQSDSEAALMLEWITLAACRTGEARFAVWGEIDLERNVWSIPAARMKMRRDHVVPITGRMLEILAEAKRRHNSKPAPTDYVFTGGKGKPLTEMAALMMIRRMAAFKGYTGHGLRATFKGWAATCTEFPRELIEEQLAHQLGAVEQAYMRVSAVERRRVMMEAWAAYCQPPVATADDEPDAAGLTPKRGRPRKTLSETRAKLAARAPSELTRADRKLLSAAGEPIGRAQNGLDYASRVAAEWEAQLLAAGATASDARREASRLAADDLSQRQRDEQRASAASPISHGEGGRRFIATQTIWEEDPATGEMRPVSLSENARDCGDVDAQPLPDRVEGRGATMMEKIARRLDSVTGRRQREDATRTVQMGGLAEKLGGADATVPKARPAGRKAKAREQSV